MKTMAGRLAATYQTLRAALLRRPQVYDVHSAPPTVFAQSRPDQPISAGEAQWYQEAAEQGIVSAQWVLGAMYENGTGGFMKDYAEAVRWYRLSADQGSATAQSLLGLMYQNGRGVTQNRYEAVRLFRRAAEKSHPSAQTLLGISYFHGWGVPQDYAESHRWFQAAGQQGHVWAQWTVGSMYLNSLGVEQNLTAAYAWLSAAARELQKAVECLDQMTELMTVEQIEEAWLMASELWKRIEANHKPDPLIIGP